MTIKVNRLKARQFADLAEFLEGGGNLIPAHPKFGDSGYDHGQTIFAHIVRATQKIEGGDIVTDVVLEVKEFIPFSASTGGRKVPMKFILELYEAMGLFEA